MVSELGSLTESEFDLDLFVPPEREPIREATVRLASQKLSQRERRANSDGVR
jgi:hypothetical protein